VEDGFKLACYILIPGGAVRDHVVLLGHDAFLWMLRRQAQAFNVNTTLCRLAGPPMLGL